MPSQEKRQRQKANTQAAREAKAAAEKRKRMFRTGRNVAIVVVLFVVVVLVVSLFNRSDDKKSSSTTSTTAAPTSTTAKTASVKDPALDPAKTYTANIATNMGNIVLALNAKDDPIGAAHFVANAKAGVYNGSRWHRVVKDFVIQGGAPGGDPNKPYDKSVVAEVPKDHYPVGSVAAAKTGQDPAGSFASQFFIVTGAEQGGSLPNDYARFGTVKSGMDVVNKIGALPVDGSDDPMTKATIDKITIAES